MQQQGLPAGAGGLPGLGAGAGAGVVMQYQNASSNEPHGILVSLAKWATCSMAGS